MPTKFFRIHPAIGIARVGDADRTQKDFFFIGPEVPGIPANFDTAKQAFRPFKLGSKVRPQAVRFRVFEFERSDDGQTKLIGETKLNERGVTAMSWTVHVANRKASFVKFEGQRGAEAKPLFSDYTAAQVRNKSVKGVADRRQQLDLDPGPKSIAGGAADKVELSFSNGPKGLKKIKTLGELRSDTSGRLIFIGGKGHAEKFADPNPGKDLHFANNDGWVDDTSDGPVTAEITIGGQTFAASGAWVMTGPPDFVPAQRSYRTLYDTLADMMARETVTADGPFAVLPAPLQRLREIWASRQGPKPIGPSFAADIYPMLEAMCRLHRVHARFEGEPEPANYHGDLGGKAFDKLGKKPLDTDAAALVFGQMRSPRVADALSSSEMPRVWGNDALDPKRPMQFHTVSELQYHMLRQWSEGNAELDWTGSPPAADSNDITPDGLDRAALENATGGPYCPGIEMGWLGTKVEAYAAPLRFALGKAVGSFKVPGTKDNVRSVVVEAGVFSQQMALPWQADFHACSREQRGQLIAAWWPVQRPDEVVRSGETAYSEWARGVATKEAMTTAWESRGFVVQTKGDLFEIDGPGDPLVA